MNAKTQAHDMQAKYALTQFTTSEVRKFWPKLEEMLDLLPHTWRHWSKEYIWESIENKTIVVWGAGTPPDAELVFFTVINVYPSTRVMCVPWMAGKFEGDMMPLIDATISNFAKLNSCDEVEIRGRRGWNPHLKKIGFKQEAMVWTRRVADMRIN